MEYETFKESLIENLKTYLPDEYEEWHLEIREIPKVNGYLEGVNLLPKSGIGETPTLYLSDLYQYYQVCNDMEKVCQKAASTFVEGMKYAAFISETVSLDMAPENIIYCLINADKNQRLLQDVPHRMVMDLALIYRMMICSGEDGFNS